MRSIARGAHLVGFSVHRCGYLNATVRPSAGVRVNRAAVPQC
jgi:hypothetical protein